MCSICQQLEVVQLSSLPGGSVFIIRHIETSPPAPIRAFSGGLLATSKPIPVMDGYRNSHRWTIFLSTLTGRVFHITDVSVLLVWAVVFLYYVSLFYFILILFTLTRFVKRTFKILSHSSHLLFLKVGKPASNVCRCSRQLLCQNSP